MTYGGFEDFTRSPDWGRIEAITQGEPFLFKCRHPELVPWVATRFPEARLVVRVPGEGYDAGSMLDGYNQFRDVLDRYRNSILTFTFANEPNHSDKNVDPEWWLGEAHRFLAAYDSPVPLCIPGLQPYHRTSEWMPILQRLYEESGRFQYVGAHCYYQLPDSPVGSMGGLLSWYSWAPRERIILLETNLGHGPYSPEQRAAACRDVAQIAAEQGMVGCVVFGMGGGGWTQFDLTDDGYRAVLAAARTPAIKRRKKPVPKKKVEVPAAPEFRFGMKEYAESHEGVGEPAMNEVQIAPGVAMQMTTTGMLFFSQEAANNGIPPVRFSLDPFLK